MSDDLAGAAEEAAAIMAASRHVVALVGAGMSAESGIPTFRGKEGIWTKHGEPDLRDYDRYLHAEGNSPAHIKATLVGQSVTLPVDGGRLALGTWQGVFLAEFDGPRRRTIVVNVVVT